MNVWVKKMLAKYGGKMLATTDLEKRFRKTILLKKDPENIGEKSIWKNDFAKRLFLLIFWADAICSHFFHSTHRVLRSLL